VNDPRPNHCRICRRGPENNPRQHEIRNRHAAETDWRSNFRARHTDQTEFDFSRARRRRFGRLQWEQPQSGSPGSYRRCFQESATIKPVVHNAYKYIVYPAFRL